MADTAWPPATPLYARLERWLGPLVRAYGRVEVRGRERLPTGGAILAANHPGSLWWDALSLAAGLAPRPITFVANPWDFPVPLLGPFLRRVGALEQPADVAAISADDPVVAAARAGQFVCHFPEESYHTFARRYTLFRFVPHTIRYAELAGVPIVPTAIVGVEEAAATLVGFKRAGVPLHFPLVPPVVLPLKIIVELGAPLTAGELTSKKISAPDAGLLAAEFAIAAADCLRGEVARLLAKHRAVRVSDIRYLEYSGW